MPRVPATTSEPTSKISTVPEDGYYWARHDDGTAFVVLLQDGWWFTPGVGYPINNTFRPSQLIMPIKRPDH